MALGALINGGTFGAFTFLAPVVTKTGGLAEGMAISCAGDVRQRIGPWRHDRRTTIRSSPGVALAVGGPLLLRGWIVLTLVASHLVALVRLVIIQGFLSFSVGRARRKATVANQ